MMGTAYSKKLKRYKPHGECGVLGRIRLSGGEGVQPPECRQGYCNLHINFKRIFVLLHQYANFNVTQMGLSVDNTRFVQ